MLKRLPSVVLNPFLPKQDEMAKLAAASVGELDVKSVQGVAVYSMTGSLRPQNYHSVVDDNSRGC